MKSFSITVLLVVSFCFAALKLAQAQAPDTARSQCMTKCTETFKTCLKGAATDGAKEACRRTLKACVLACPKK